MKKDALTQKQRRLVTELDALASRLGLDYHNILDEERELRTTALEAAQRHLIRSEVKSQYVLMDELLNDVICRYFFGRKRSFPKL